MTRLVIILIILTAIGAGAVWAVWNYPDVFYWIDSKAYEYGLVKIDDGDWMIADFDYTEKKYDWAKKKYWGLLCSEKEFHHFYMFRYAYSCLVENKMYQARWWFTRYQEKTKDYRLC